MSLQEIVGLVHKGEYESAISLLEHGAGDTAKSPIERSEYCRWLAECYQGIEDHKKSGDWYLQAIKEILSQSIDLKLKAKQALPLCEKALESYKMGADTVDVFEAAKLKQRLLQL